MMATGDVRQFLGKIPVIEEQPAGIGVGVSENLLLRDVQRATAVDCIFQALAKLCRINDGDNQESEIVENPAR